MTGTVIDRLVVELGLDPKKFGSGVGDAQKKLGKFDAAVKALGIDEGKLDTQQKKALASIRGVATQAERTGKELKSSGEKGGDFFGVLTKGAALFGVALSAIALKNFAQNTIDTTAAAGRMAHNLGMSTAALTVWGDAIHQAVGGDAAAAANTLRSLSSQVAGFQYGQIPEELMQTLGLLSKYNGDKPIAVMKTDAAGNVTPLPPDQILLSMADALKNAYAANPQEARRLGDMAGLDDDTFNFLIKGRAADEAILAQQRNRPGVPTEQDVKTLQDLQSAEANVAIAATRAAQALELLGAPYILNGLKNMSAFFEWAARGFKDKDKFDDQVRQNDAAMHATPLDPEGKGWLAELDAKRAANEEMARSPSAKLKKNASRLGFLLRGRAGPTENDPGLEPFSELDIARIKQLILQGIYPDDAVSVVKAERAAGRPSGPVGVIKIPGAPADFGGLEQQHGLPAGTLAAVRQVESAGKDNAVSSAGAQGPFQMMPRTQSQYGVTDPFDLANEAPGAAANLADLIGKFHTVRKGLAAYNWGEGNLDADIKAHGDQWERFLPKETTDYLAKLGQINPALAPGAGDVVTQTTTINGNIIVQTQATDAKGIARGLKDEIEQQRNRHAVAQSTTGLM